MHFKNCSSSRVRGPFQPCFKAHVYRKGSRGDVNSNVGARSCFLLRSELETNISSGKVQEVG